MLKQDLQQIDTSNDINELAVKDEIKKFLNQAGYTIVEANEQKPWGAYYRLEGTQAPDFIQEFFPGLTIEDARLGIDDAELSPKILLVKPRQRLSWQYHDRRAERWAFLTPGAYNKSLTDEPGEPVYANTGDIVQFAKGERHRLIGAADEYTIVAEIWQHSDPLSISDEDDIVRLADDYSR